MAEVNFNDSWAMDVVPSELQPCFSQIHLSLALVDALHTEFSVATYPVEPGEYYHTSFTARECDNMAFACKTIKTCLESALYLLARHDCKGGHT